MQWPPTKRMVRMLALSKSGSERLIPLLEAQLESNEDTLVEKKDKAMKTLLGKQAKVPTGMKTKSGNRKTVYCGVDLEGTVAMFKRAQKPSGRHTCCICGKGGSPIGRT